MNAIRSKVVVIEDDVGVRSSMCTWLSNDGYAVYECRDSFRALMLIRKIVPDLVIASTDIKGVSPKLLLEIVENDGISHILFVTQYENSEFKRLLKCSKVKTYCLKPVESHEFLDRVKNALMWLENLRNQKKLEERSRPRDDQSFVIKKATELIMSKWNLSEEQAYSYIRKKSMNLCIPIQVLSKKIIASENKD